MMSGAFCGVSGAARAFCDALEAFMLLQNIVPHYRVASSEKLDALDASAEDSIAKCKPKCCVLVNHSRIVRGSL